MPADWDDLPVDVVEPWVAHADPYLPRAPFEPEDRGKPYFYGSSLDFDDWLREHRPHARIPQREIVPLDGAIGWTPAHEDPGAGMCPSCLTTLQESRASHAALLLHRIRPLAKLDGERVDGDDQGLEDQRDLGPGLYEQCPLCRGIDWRSRLFCPKCNASGFDGRAAYQRSVAGLPPAEREPSQPPAPREANAAAPERPEDRSLTRRERRAQQFGTRPDGDEPDGHGREEQEPEPTGAG